MKSSTNKLVLTAILSAFAMITFLLESLLPPLFIPGARLGLSNLFILFALIALGTKSAIIVFAVKIIFGSIFAGNISTLMYSLPSGILSLMVEIILFNLLNKKLSLPAISVSGAVVNVTIQNIVYVLVTKTPRLIIYLPYLATVSLFTGFIVGAICLLLTRYFPLEKFKGTQDII